MSRYLREVEHNAIKQLRGEGMMIMAIAKKFNVCQATVSNICRGITQTRAPRKKSDRPKYKKIPDAHEIEFEDFSILPDDVLFEHVRECNFVG